MTSPHPTRPAPQDSAEDERYGLDLLATAIDEVAAQLPPSNVVPMSSPRTPSPDDETAPSSNLERGSATSRLLALAAAVLVTLLAWPAYLGWVRLPEVQQQLAEAHSAAGPVDLAWLSPPRQGERTGSPTPPPTELTVPSSGSVVWLLELPVDVRPRLQQGALIELVRTSEDSALESQAKRWSLDAQTLADHLARHDGVPLLLQAGDLAPGPYRLQWLDDDGDVVSGVDVWVAQP